MLAHTGAAYLDDRTELLDGEPDELWSDATLIRFFNEGMRILARRSWCIIEYGKAPAGVITLKTGVTLYPYHKSVLRVYDGTPTTQTAPLGRGTDEGLRQPNPEQGDAFEIGEAASLLGNTTIPAPGNPIAIATDAGSRTIRVFPPPAAAQNGLQVTLKVARMPICWLDIGKLDACPEVPEDYHMWLCDYAAGRCLTMPNVDGSMKTDGYKLLADFDEHVKEARRDRQRMERATGRWAFQSTTSVIQ